MLLGVFTENLRTVLWLAAVPAFIAVAILAFGIREPEASTRDGPRPRFDLATAKLLGSAFWLVTGLGAAMMLARFSEAFLVLKAADAGFTLTYVPIVMAVMSGVYALSSYPAGALSDRFGRKSLLIAGLGVLIAADLVLAYAAAVPAVLAGVALWGLHMGLTQGLLSTMVADTAAAEFRGTAFGVFNLASGMALLLASLGAGALWDAAGAKAVFLAGAAVAVMPLIAAVLMKAGRDNHSVH